MSRFNFLTMRSSRILHSPTRAFGKDALKYVPAQISLAIISFFSVVVYTRLLNPEQYGDYILVIVTTTIVSSTIFGWVNQSGIRYLEESKEKNLLAQFFSTSLISLLALLLIVIPLWYCTVIIFKKTWSIAFIRLLQIGGVVLISQTGYSFLLILLRADRRVFKYGLYVVLNSLGAFFIAIGLIKFMKFGSGGILVGMIVSSGTFFLLELVHLQKHYPIKVSKYSINMLKKFASYGIPMVGVSIGGLIMAVADRYMIRYFMASEAVGIYSASYSLGQKSVQGIADILMLAAFPVILQTFVRKGEEKTGTLIKNLIGIYFVALVPVIFGGAILSKDLVGTILGKSFRGASAILPWVMGGTFCERLALYCGASLKLKEKTSSLLFIWIVGAAINIVLNVFWIPLFGVFGAAYATLAAYFTCLVVIWIVGCKFLSFGFPWQSLWKAISAALGMALILKVGFSDLPIKAGYLILKIVFGASIYFILLGVLREKFFLKILRLGAAHLKRIWSQQTL